MAKIERFEDVEAWRHARKVTRSIYTVSSDGAFAKDFALVNQIRRAAVSTLSNIAEGFERNGDKEFVQFLTIAKGSCGEVRAQLYVAPDQEYITEEEFQRINIELTSTSRIISGLINYLKRSELKGSRFRVA